MSEILGRCDKKAYEHRGLHPKYTGYCIDWQGETVVCQQATKGLFEGHCVKPEGHDGFCSPKPNTPPAKRVERSPLPGQAGLLPCPLKVSQNLEGTWDILVDGALTHPRLTQWTQASANEAVRLIHEAYTRSSDASKEYVRGRIQGWKDAEDALNRLKPDPNFSVHWRNGFVYAQTFAVEAIRALSIHQR